MKSIERGELTTAVRKPPCPATVSNRLRHSPLRDVGGKKVQGGEVAGRTEDDPTSPNPTPEELPRERPLSTPNKIHQGQRSMIIGGDDAQKT